MKKNIVKKIAGVAASAAAFAAPLSAWGQQDVQSGLDKIRSPFGASGGLASSTDLVTLIVRVINLMLMFAGIVAVVFVIIGGYMYVTSAGNAEQAEKGKNTVVNAIIGIVIIVLSYVIINVIVNFVSRGQGWFG